MNLQNSFKILLRSIYVLSACFYCIPALLAQNTSIFPDSIYTPLTEGIGVYPLCEKDSISFEEVSSEAFQQNFKEGIGFSEGCKHWLRLKLYLPKEATGNYLLRQVDWDGRTVYYFPTPDGSYEKAYSGLTVPPSQRSFNYPRYDKAHALLIGGDTLQIFLLMDFEADDYMKAPRLRIKPLSVEYIIERESSHGVLLITLASLLLITIYNLAIFFYTRDKAYFFYSLSFLFLMPYLIVVNGEVWQWIVLNEWTFYAGRFGIFSASIATFFYLQFSIIYLGGKGLLPKMYRWARGVTYIGGGIITLFGASTLYLGYGNGGVLPYIHDGILILCFFAMIAYAIALFLKGHTTARYYILASCIFLPFVLIFFMQGQSAAGHYGYLDWIDSTAFTRASLKIGVVVQALAFSLALAARINLLRKTIAAQALKVAEAEKVRLLEIQKLIEQQNKELEGKVQSRTQSLQEAVEELKVSEESLDRLNKTKDHFFALIAHDLRGPVASFQGLTNILQHQIKKNRTERVQQMMVQVDESANQLNALLDNLLQWAQAQIGGINYQPQEIKLQPLVEDIQQVYAGTALSKEIETSIDIQPAHLSVYADYAATATIIRNLWSNALKFTEKGSITLTATSKEGFVQITVSDTGVGMEEKKVAKLFEIDPHKSSKGTQGEKGNGLGLLLCKEFAESNKGRIWAESKLGVGTSMHLVLPIIAS